MLEIWRYTISHSTSHKVVHTCVFTQVEGIINEFQTNWSTFDGIHSDIYLSQLKVTFYSYLVVPC